MSAYVYICLHMLASACMSLAYALHMSYTVCIYLLIQCICLHILASVMHMLFSFICLTSKIIYLPKCTFLNINLGFRV